MACQTSTQHTGAISRRVLGTAQIIDRRCAVPGTLFHLRSFMVVPACRSEHQQRGTKHIRQLPPQATNCQINKLSTHAREQNTQTKKTKRREHRNKSSNMQQQNSYYININSCTGLTFVSRFLSNTTPVKPVHHTLRYDLITRGP